jgi:hypothetical protein
MDMTIERLRAFRGIQREIEEIDREISLLYYPIASPRSSETHGTTPGDPTARAVSIIMKKQEDIEVLRGRLAQELQDIEDWIDTLDDHELRAIIRAHYLLGDSWARCSQRILNYRFSEAAKFRVYRYFGII